MILLLEPLTAVDQVCTIDEQTFQYYLHWSTSKHTGGPTVVAENLLKELRLRNDLAWTLVTPETKFERNYSVMWVVNGLLDLVWAIQNKEILGISQLWAGPNLVVVPQEAQGTIGHSQIDKVVVPCRWVAEVYSALMPSISNKIVIWPVGIDVEAWTPDPAKEKRHIVVYDKRNTGLADELTTGLCSSGELVSRVTYGKYSRSHYKELLDHAKAIIWLSATESQGIALLEALAMNVPALCLKNSTWNYHSAELQTDYQYEGATAAPYFSDQCGLLFSNAQDFLQQQYPVFCKMRNYFTPRKYLFANNLIVGKSLSSLIEGIKS